MKLYTTILLIWCIGSTSAESVIYDTIDTSIYKSITLSDDTNIRLLNEYKYDVYINNSFLGTYDQNDKIFVPDNSNISIYIPKSNINTDVGSIWETGKTQIFIAIMYISSGLVILLMLLFIFRKVWR